MSDQIETDRTTELEAQLAEARRKAEAAERRRAIDLELMKAGAIDFEIAGDLAERAAAAGSDLPAAVRDLKRARPYLFRSPPVAPNANPNAAPIRDPDNSLADLAEAARRSGNRRMLLGYMRAKRAD